MSTEKYEQTIGYALKRLYLLRSKAFDEALKEYGLARSQWQALYLVNKAGELAQKELQAAMKIESATLTRIVDSLVRKGWLERTESVADKRARILRPTRGGRERCNEVPALLEGIERKMLRGIDARGRKQLREDLNRMIENLEGLEKKDRRTGPDQGRTS